jgi:Dolichyl-phosphate-mannose-protein mannosyltransferase
VTGLLRSPRYVAAAGLVLLWGAAAAFLALWFSGRVRDWSVMTDEMQYAKLAIAVAETGSPLPSLHDTTVSLANQLYPLLLAPLYGSLSSPDAFRGAHVLNAVVMTSAVIPAYLLARELLTRPWSFAVAVLTVVMPWLVLTGFVMSEVVAYPAFLWAALAFHRTIVEPSPRRDVVAVVALGIAILARTQFAALALVLPLAILGHEVGGALASGTGAGARQRLAAGARAAARRHRTLWALYALGALVAIVVLLAGYRLFGAYETTVEEGSVLPWGTWWSAVEHVAVVGIGCGVVPLVLGGGWMLASVVRPSSSERRALATLSLLLLAALALETASFDLRFGGADIVRDRYLFYVVPLLLVGSAAALTERRRGPTAVGAGLITGLLAAGSLGLAFPTFPGISVDSPVSILNETLIDQAGSLGTGTFVALLVLLLGAVLVLALLLAPRIPLAVVLFTSVLAFSTVMLHSEVGRVLDGTGLSSRPLAGPPGVVLDWVDSVVPEGESAALVAFPISTAWGVSAIQWWDVEFWNRDVTRAYVAPDGNFTYTPFPTRTLDIDPVTGEIEGTADAPAYVVGAPGDPRFGLVGAEHAANAGIRVQAVERPYRAAWSSRGLSTDGWTRPGVAASIRVHAPPGAAPEVSRVRIGLRAPESAEARYRITTETADRTGAIAAAEFTEETVLVCIAGGSPVDVFVRTPTGALAPGPPLMPEPEPHRQVGVLLGPVDVRGTGRPCDAA